MNQTLHIFAKDTRRFRWEIVISLALTAAYTWIYPRQWHHASTLGFSGIGAIAVVQNQFLTSILTVLIPVSWWLLITRAVHAESLVGDRQFWLTRPYEWPNLLAAKALFVLAYVFLPILIAQCLLLAQAGFPPFSYGPGLAYNLMLLAAVLVLPLASLAAVTSSSGRLLLVILGIFMCPIAIFALLAGLDGINIAVAVPGRTGFLLPLTVLLCGAAILSQYATRRVWTARLLLIALPVLSVGIFALLRVDALMTRAYPATTQPPLRLSLLDDAMDHPVLSRMQSGKLEVVQISLPIHVNGIRQGDLLTPNDVRLSIQSANGVVWNSPWRPVGAMYFGDAPMDTSFDFPMERTIFDQLKGQPVTLHLSVAFTEAKASGIQRVPMPNHDFPVPNFGVCSPQVGLDDAQQTRIFGIACRAPLRQPQLTYVEALWSNTPCTDAPTDPGLGVQGAAWVGNLDTDPAEFGIPSVWNTPVQISNGWVNERKPNAGSGFQQEALSRAISAPAPRSPSPATLWRAVFRPS